MTYLFVLAPTDSGSTVLHHLLLTSKAVTGLPLAGQSAHGYSGPTPAKFGTGHLFSQSADQLSDGELYDWKAIKSVWEELWANPSPFDGSWGGLLAEKVGNEPVKLQKSPPDIYRVEMLKDNFQPAKWLVMVRDPYATAANVKKFRPETSYAEIAKHVGECYKKQQENLELLGDDALKFTYEELCNSPKDVTQKIIEHVPELKSVDLEATLPSGDLNLTLTNLNETDVATLTPEDVAEINKVLADYEDAVKFWGYTVQ